MGAALTDAAALVDEATGSPVLVVGSLPPGGRDLDVLVDSADRDAVAAQLERNGFERHRDSWVRFAGLSAFAVDLIPREEWLGPDAWRETLAAARPVGSLGNVLRPSPAHALLVLARKLAHERGPLRDKHRRRIEEELAEDPAAWDGARSAAPAWGLDAELGRLRDRTSVRDGKRVLPGRPRRGAIVAFSGLDGSGKSSQSRALADALERLGWETESVWVPLGSSATLQRVAGAGKRAIARARKADAEAVVGERLLSNPGGDRGERGAALVAAATAWSTAGAAANALAHLRAAAGSLATGKVVIFDRYVLDTIVHLRFTYGGVRHPAQERLVRLLSPSPIAAFFLDVPPEVALSRKHDWDLPVLERQAALYREEHAALGVRRLDGERPREELAAEIAREVWHRLR